MMSRIQIIEWHICFEVSKMDARELRMTPSQDDLPHRKLMITFQDWSSWCGMIIDWQYEWLRKNSVSTGNRCGKSGGLSGDANCEWPGNAKSDNEPARNAIIMRQLLIEKETTTLDHPLYSPDLTLLIFDSGWKLWRKELIYCLQMKSRAQWWGIWRLKSRSIQMLPRVARMNAVVHLLTGEALLRGKFMMILKM